MSMCGIPWWTTDIGGDSMEEIQMIQGLEN